MVRRLTFDKWRAHANAKYLAVAWGLWNQLPPIRSTYFMLIFSCLEHLPGIRTPTIRIPYNLRATATSYVLTTLRPFF